MTDTNATNTVINGQSALPATNHADEVERLERLANRLDAAFRIPGTGIRLGWDSILGVLPGVGDLVTIAPGVYIMHRDSALGVPGHKLARMGLNVGIDWVVGSIPLLGDIFDVGFKSNRRNVRLIREHFGLPERHPLTSGNH